MSVDLASLPPPAVIETLAFETLLAECKADFVERFPAAAEVIDLESEPVVKLLESFAYRELKLRARYNDEAKSLLLAFAEDADLDHIGVTYYNGARRLVVTLADGSALPPTPAVMESNFDYRQRLAMQPEGESVAGPRDGYRYHAMSAHGHVKDARPRRPVAGTVEVSVLSRIGNGLPDAGLIKVVEAALNEEAVRPMNDEVIVSPAKIVDYALDIGLVLFPGPAAEPVIGAVKAALEGFAQDHHRLGRDIVKSAIDAAAHVSGVKKVVINSPAADIACGLDQAPWCSGITVSIAGIE